MPLPEPRSFAPAVPSARGEEPLLIGLVGPPGGGKTASALRLATGMRAVRPGPVVLIDTEGGRSRKYSPEPGQKADSARLIFDFLRVDMTPPFRPHDFLAAIQAQLKLKPAAIIVDTLSDEHEGEGGYLEWHDEQVPKMGGNEWAAWAMPKAARKRLLSGLLQIKAPLLFTFRAREKTATERGKGKGGKDLIVNIGWMPVAPLEIVHTLDLTCILPPKADGVPVWSSEKIGEDFIVKLPGFLKPLVGGGQLNEATGEALARWAMGSPAAAKPVTAADVWTAVKHLVPAEQQRAVFAEILPEGKGAPLAAAARALEALRRHPVCWRGSIDRLPPEDAPQDAPEQPADAPLLDADTVATLRDLATSKGVRMQEIEEEVFGGPLEDQPATAEARVVEEINSRAKAKAGRRG